MNAKQLILTGILILLLPVLATASALNWMTDLEQAKIEAKQTGKHLFVSFSGSDWCHWCIKMDKEIFATEAFKNFAQHNLVAVMIDFPKRKKLSKELQNRNDALARQFAVRGFPTIVILTPDGEYLTTTGFRQGGAEAYVEHLSQIINK